MTQPAMGQAVMAQGNQHALLLNPVGKNNN